MPLPQQSIPAAAFARVLSKLPADLPVITAVESPDDSDPQGPEKRPVWYSSQKEHMVRWFLELDGPGAYNRKSRGLDARHGYNHSLCWPGLLWIAEALGEDESTLWQAVTAAGAVQQAGGRLAAQCAAWRRVIPWARIEELFAQQPSRPRFRPWRRAKS